MKRGIVVLLSKVVDVISKVVKSGEKTQDLQDKKINVYSKVLTIIVLVVLAMCVLDSLFPGLAISEYWYHLLDELIKSIQ